ncbi:hypothetical protein J6590_065769 [Homalodisca vitripennis]|nr:hypothetical protein J6590_065769 [Homalodisca vitripennis]
MSRVVFRERSRSPGVGRCKTSCADAVDAGVRPGRNAVSDTAAARRLNTIISDYQVPLPYTHDRAGMSPPLARWVGWVGVGKQQLAPSGPSAGDTPVFRPFDTVISYFSRPIVSDNFPLQDTFLYRFQEK